MVVMDEIATVKNFFHTHQVPLTTAWLEGCISWCKEENLPPNYTIKDLQLKVYEQWLLLDLRDLEEACLPPNLSDKKHYVLNGNFSLQMMQVVDISKPKHWQLQRIRNNISKNTEQEIESSKRVLQLTLTDGVQEVEAMEYNPIPSLNLNLTPGIKIRLMGPVDVRRGRLMLKNENIKILGGEVDDLIVPNAAENVLAKRLNLPLNPKPQVIEESLITANKDIFNGIDQINGIVAPQNNIRSNLPNQSLVTNQRQQPTINSANILGPGPQRSVDINEEEEMRIAAEISMIMEIENEFEEPATKKLKSPSTTPDMFDDMDVNDYDFENINIPETMIKTNKDIPQTSTANLNNTPTNSESKDLDLSASLDAEDDIFENMDLDAHLDQIDRHLEDVIAAPKKNVILTVEKLLRNIPNISNGKFKIKAKYKSVVEKLTVVDDKFHLVVKVEDETGDITVKFHNDVVADMAELSSTALMSLKQGVLENNMVAQSKVLEALRRIKDKLVQLNNVVEVQVSNEDKFPVIVNIL